MSEEHGSEFWEEEAVEDRRHLRRHVVRWIVLFAVVLGFLFFVLWWTSSALHYSASRVQRNTGPTYLITGVVRDANTGAPIPWARVADSPDGHPPHFETTADHLGHFELATIPEPHRIMAAALGFRPAAVPIGRRWFLWMPKGNEQVEVRLQSETANAPTDRQ